MGRWGNPHVHSMYSKIDGMTTVERIFEKSAKYEHPFLALTDHGSMAGTVRAYQTAAKLNIPFFPGFEGYLLDPSTELDDKKAGRFHFGILALDKTGYEGLVRLMSLSHTRPRFSRFPRLTIDDLTEFSQEGLADHVAFTTGCFFGLVQQSLVNESERKARAAIKLYQKLFPNLFVELQNHNIEHNDEFNDSTIASHLWSEAQMLGLPVLATQDSHYVNQSEKDAHALMKRMVYSGSDDEFPGDTFHVPTETWVSEHYEPAIWESALEGSDELLSLHDLQLPALDEYKPHVPKMGKKKGGLRRFVRKLLAKFGFTFDQRYNDRIDYECEIIEQLGMEDYFWLVHTFRKWCKQENICIEVRGSANGSLVLFLLGVTTTDPIVWDLLFDRFLSLDRIQPPDVDIDIEDKRRGDAIAKLQEMFPGAVQIGTWTSLGLREDDGQGSIVVTYKMMLGRLHKEAEKRAHDHAIEDGLKPPPPQPFKFGWLQNIDQVRSINKRDWVNLKKIDAMGSVKKSYGVHAAGVLLPGSDMAIDEYVPTMLVASSETIVSQFDQDDVEKLGLLKLDLLGQKTLTIMRACQEAMGVDDPTDFSWIPNDDLDACKLLCEGRTFTGLFHFDKAAKVIGAKKMGIRTTKEVIEAIALFMPGAMDVAPGMTESQTDLYLQRKKNAAARRTITYLHPAFEQALKSTYGAVIYQEQVINIMRSLGMSVVGVNKFFKVVKDSGKGAVARNKDRVAEVREEFDQICIDKGLDPDEVWRATASFVSYGFNKAHATGYGIRAYRCAYLKYHHGPEFMEALLTAWTGDPMEKTYSKEARRMGLRILPPDVNISGASWTLDDRGRRPVLRRGLVSVARVGPSAAISIERAQPFSSIEDLIERTDSRAVTGGKNFDGTTKSLTGTLKALYEANALDTITEEK